MCIRDSLDPVEALRFNAREVKILEGAIPSPGRALEYEQGFPSRNLRIAITDGLAVTDSVSLMGRYC